MSSPLGAYWRPRATSDSPSSDSPPTSKKSRRAPGAVATSSWTFARGDTWRTVDDTLRRHGLGSFWLPLYVTLRELRVGSGLGSGRDCGEARAARHHFILLDPTSPRLPPPPAAQV